MLRTLILIAFLLVVYSSAFGQQSDLTGFSQRSADRQRQVETKLKALLSPQRAEQHLRWLSSRPHRTGTEGTRITVEYLHEHLQKFGFDTKSIRYDAYLPAPVAFWDAEEMLLGGSTEWVEEHAEELLEKGVACINMDSSVFNTERPLSVAAHTVLHRLYREVARDIRDPRSGRNLFEVWRDLQNRYRKVPSVDGWGEFFDPNRELVEPWIFEAPYDDAAPFYYFLALPASDMYYGADYGMYHSIYENFHWMKTVVDPTFEYHTLMSQVQGLAALRLANADLVPLDYANEAHFWRLAYKDLAQVAKQRNQKVPQLEEALRLIDQWQTEAKALQTDMAELLKDVQRMATARPHLGELNRSLYQAARDFLRREGRPGMPTSRNLFAGWSYDFEGVSGSTLPGLRFALDEREIEEAEREARLYVGALRRRVQTLDTLRQRLQGIQ